MVLCLEKPLCDGYKLIITSKCDEEGKWEQDIEHFSRQGFVVSTVTSDNLSDEQIHAYLKNKCGRIMWEYTKPT